MIFFLNSCININIPIAKSFDEDAIDNEFNNRIGSGYYKSMAYIDGCLYLKNTVGDSVIKLNNKGSTELKTDMFIDEIYSHNGNLFCYDDGNVYELKNSIFKPSSIVNSYYYIDGYTFINNNDGTFTYITDDKVVNLGNKDTFSISDFCYEKDTLYLVKREELYRCDLKLCSKALEKIGYLENKDQDICQVSNNFIYYPYFDDESNKAGLAKYSIKNNKIEYLTEQEVSSINKYNKTIYYSDKIGIHSINNNGKQSDIIDKSADAIYIFDKKWIYLYNITDSTLRVTHNGKQIEKLDIKSS
jgi:hypothetical protein